MISTQKVERKDYLGKKMPITAIQYFCVKPFVCTSE